MILPIMKARRTHLDSRDMISNSDLEVGVPIAVGNLFHTTPSPLEMVIQVKGTDGRDQKEKSLTDLREINVRGQGRLPQ